MQRIILFQRISKRIWDVGTCETQRITKFFAKGRNELDKFIYVETKFVMFVAKNNEPFIICNEFSKIGSHMSRDSELAKKLGAGKTKTAQIIKGRKN